MAITAVEGSTPDPEPRRSPDGVAADRMLDALLALRRQLATREISEAQYAEARNALVAAFELDT